MASLAAAPRRVAILGAGSFGTAMAAVAARGATQHPALFDPTVRMWARREAVAEEISSAHTNTAYLGETVLPSNIIASSDLAAVVAASDLLVIAIPHSFLDALLPAIAAALPRIGAGAEGGAIAVSLVKSLHFDKATNEIMPLSTHLVTSAGGGSRRLAH